MPGLSLRWHGDGEIVGGRGSAGRTEAKHREDNERVRMAESPRPTAAPSAAVRARPLDWKHGAELRQGFPTRMPVTRASSWRTWRHRRTAAGESSADGCAESPAPGELRGDPLRFSPARSDYSTMRSGGPQWSPGCNTLSRFVRRDILTPLGWRARPQLDSRPPGMTLYYNKGDQPPTGSGGPRWIFLHPAGGGSCPLHRFSSLRLRHEWETRFSSGNRED